MAQIQRYPNLPSMLLEDFSAPGSTKRWLAKLLASLDTNFRLILDVLNRRIGADNFEKYDVSVAATGAANAENTVTHNLGFTPPRIIVTSIDRACSVYDSRRSDWTTTQIFFKCSVANGAVKFLLIR